MRCCPGLGVKTPCPWPSGGRRYASSHGQVGGVAPPVGMSLGCRCPLTRFPKGLSSWGFGVREDQSTTRARNVPMTSKLRRIKPTFNLMSGALGLAAALAKLGWESERLGAANLELTWC